jgi:hypothetical protein
VLKLRDRWALYERGTPSPRRYIQTEQTTEHRDDTGTYHPGCADPHCDRRHSQDARPAAQGRRMKEADERPRPSSDRRVHSRKSCVSFPLYLSRSGEWWIRCRQAKTQLCSSGNMNLIRRPRRPWKSEEDDQLRLSMTSGRSAPEIAVALERTTRSVRRRAEILKLSWKGKSTLRLGEAKPNQVGSASVKALIASPRWTPEEDDRLKRLAEEGATASAIAERLRRTRAAIYTRAKKLDVKCSPIVKPPRR